MTIKKFIGEGNGVLIKPFKYLRCYLFDGHDYVRTSPEYQGSYCVKCRKCGYETVL